MDSEGYGWCGITVTDDGAVHRLTAEYHAVARSRWSVAHATMRAPERSEPMVVDRWPGTCAAAIQPAIAFMPPPAAGKVFGMPEMASQNGCCFASSGTQTQHATLVVLYELVVLTLSSGGHLLCRFTLVKRHAPTTSGGD